MIIVAMNQSLVSGDINFDAEICITLVQYKCT